MERPSKRIKLSTPQSAPAKPVSIDEVIVISDSDDENGSPVTPASTSSAPQVIDADGDGACDVEIVPLVAGASIAPITASTAVAATPIISPGREDDDLQAVAVVSTAIVYPHARADCPVNKFEQMNTDIGHTLNVKKCAKCYCYVCDIEASKCASWETHCMASDKRTAWRNLRTRKRARPSQPVDVPSLLLPPKLRSKVGPQISGLTGPPRSKHQMRGALYFARKTIPPANAAPQASAQAENNGNVVPGSTRHSFGLTVTQKEAQPSKESGSSLREKMQEKLAKTAPLLLARSVPEMGRVYSFKRNLRSRLNPRPPKSSDQSFVIGKIDFWRPYCSHRCAKIPSALGVPSLGFSTGRVGSDLFLVEGHGAETNIHEILAVEMGFKFEERNVMSPMNCFAMGRCYEEDDYDDLALDRDDDSEDDFDPPATLDTMRAKVRHAVEKIRPRGAPPHLDRRAWGRGAIGGSSNATPDPLAYYCSANKMPIAGYVITAMQNCVELGLVSVRWELVHHEGSAAANPDGALSHYHQSLAPSKLGDEAFLGEVKKTESWLKKRETELAHEKVLNHSNCCCLRAYISLLPKAFGSNNVTVGKMIAEKNSPEDISEPIDAGRQGQRTQTAGGQVPVTQNAGSQGQGAQKARSQEQGTRHEMSTQVQPVHFSQQLGALLTVVDFADFCGHPLSEKPTAFLPKSMHNPLLKTSFRGTREQDAKLVSDQENVYASSSAMIPDGDDALQQKLFSIEGILSSPLFTVSTGYRGGSAPQPKGISVPLRPYQLETLKWMEDQEARSSISEPFWVKLSMAPCVGNRVVKNSAWTPFWYCPLTGSISKYPPSRVVGGVLAEEMGLGKTVLAISMISNSVSAARDRPHIGKGSLEDPLRAKSTLIITPVNLLEQWRLEFERHTEPDSIRVCVWYGSRRSKLPADIAEYDVVLTTYSTMASSASAAAMYGIDWYRIIIDESTYTKGGSTTALNRCLLKIRAKRRWAVSGTPFANNIKAIAPIFRFLGVSPFSNDKLFQLLVEEFNRRLMHGHIEPAPCPHLLPSMPTAALAYTLKSLVMRHLKRQKLHGRNLVELPPSTGRMIKVGLNSAELVNYKEVESGAQLSATHILVSEQRVNRNIIPLRSYLLPVRLATSGIVRKEVRTNVPGQTARVFSTMSLPHSSKVSQLIADIRNIRIDDPIAKFVIFCDNDPLKTLVKTELGKATIDFCALDGNMAATKRGQILQLFKHEPEMIALVLSTKFAHGLTLTMANVVVLLEPSESQELELQAVDRVRRIGQTRQTTCLTYVAESTLDERVADLRKMKGQAPAIGMAVPKGGNELLSHATTYRILFGVDSNGNPSVS